MMNTKLRLNFHQLIQIFLKGSMFLAVFTKKGAPCLNCFLSIVPYRDNRPHHFQRPLCCFSLQQAFKLTEATSSYNVYLGTIYYESSCPESLSKIIYKASKNFDEHDNSKIGKLTAYSRNLITRQLF